jgi:hypothetical protein
MKLHLLALLPLTVSLAIAGPRTSANYSIATDAADAGGRRTASANYTHDGSAGDVIGISTVAAPSQAAKHGYIGQLYEVTGLALNAAAPSVNEGSTLQLGAWLTLDDTSFLAVPAANVAWSVQSGPIDSISVAGVATAGLVYQDTPAVVQGSFASYSGALNLTVLDALPDNFGAYAGDGIGDDWQVQYFGFNNPLAAPAIDADGDGEDNRFEWIAGLIPTDPASRFQLRIEAVPSQPTARRLIFSPRLGDRTYSVIYKASLLGAEWQPLPGGIVSDDGGNAP